MTEVDAINEFGGVMTSSPPRTPNKCNARVRASVPLFNDTQYLVLQIFEILFSNFSTSGPPTQFPD